MGLGDEIESTLSAATAPIVGGWVATLRKLVDTQESLPELQEALLAQFGDLPTDDLQELMALAFELAELRGRDRAAQENAGG